MSFFGKIDLVFKFLVRSDSKLGRRIYQLMRISTTFRALHLQEKIDNQKIVKLIDLKKVIVRHKSECL